MVYRCICKMNAIGQCSSDAGKMPRQRIREAKPLFHLLKAATAVEADHPDDRHEQRLRLRNRISLDFGFKITD